MNMSQAWGSFASLMLGHDSIASLEGMLGENLYYTRHIILTYMSSPAGLQGTASSACAAGSTPCVPISLAASILRRCGGVKLEKLWLQKTIQRVWVVWWS